MKTRAAIVTGGSRGIGLAIAAALVKDGASVVVTGDPSATIADVRSVDTVFKQGVGFDPVKLVDSVKGRVGLW